MILALKENEATAVLLERTGTEENWEFEHEDSHPVNLKWGEFQTFKGLADGETKIDLVSRAQETTLVRELNSEQLITGHLRLDLL